MKDPFKPQESRIKWYYVCGVLTMVFNSIFVTILNPKEQLNTPYLDYRCVVLGIWLVITIPVIFRVIQRLMWKSSSPVLKVKILRRHLIYFGFYMVFVAQTITIYVIHTLDNDSKEI